MHNKKISVIIPTYKPGKELGLILKKLAVQEQPVYEVIIINTDIALFDDRILNGLEGDFLQKIRVIHIEKKEFDHGATRNLGVRESRGDYVMFMTQDAMPYNKQLTKELLVPFEDEQVCVVYARQLPREDCDKIERLTRDYNYPGYDIIKSKQTLQQYGIKNYFCSDVCSMYDKEKFIGYGGFVNRAIFNEDMIFAHTAIDKGDIVYYSSKAKVVHSHNYSCMEQLRRNFDNGVSQALHPEVYDGIISEGEGIKMVLDNCGKLLKKGYFYLIPKLIVKSGFKFVGFRLGKSHKRLNKKIILFLTSNKQYCNMEE